MNTYSYLLNFCKIAGPLVFFSLFHVIPSQIKKYVSINFILWEKKEAGLRDISSLFKITQPVWFEPGALQLHNPSLFYITYILKSLIFDLPSS